MRGSLDLDMERSLLISRVQKNAQNIVGDNFRCGQAAVKLEHAHVHMHTPITLGFI